MCYDVPGADHSAILLVQARQDFPEQVWIEAGIANDQPAGPFDGVVIWDSLFHLPRAAHQPLLQKACEVLAGAGGLILSSGGRDKVRFAVLLRQT